MRVFLLDAVPGIVPLLPGALGRHEVILEHPGRGADGVAFRFRIRDGRREAGIVRTGLKDGSASAGLAGAGGRDERGNAVEGAYPEWESGVWRRGQRGSDSGSDGGYPLGWSGGRSTTLGWVGENDRIGGSKIWFS